MMYFSHVFFVFFKLLKEDNLSSKFLEIEKNLFIKLIFLAGVLGFEPRMAVPKTAALPLGYAPKYVLI